MHGPLDVSYVVDLKNDTMWKLELSSAKRMAIYICVCVCVCVYIVVRNLEKLGEITVVYLKVFLDNINKN